MSRKKLMMRIIAKEKYQIASSCVSSMQCLRRSNLAASCIDCQANGPVVLVTFAPLTRLQHFVGVVNHHFSKKFGQKLFKILGNGCMPLKNISWHCFCELKRTASKTWLLRADYCGWRTMTCGRS